MALIVLIMHLPLSCLQRLEYATTLLALTIGMFFCITMPITPLFCVRATSQML